MATAGIAEAERAAIRSTVFTHLTGLVVGPTVAALYERRVLDVLTGAPGPLALETVVERTHANPGYLHVALRLLASCGWLVERRNGGDRAYEPTAEGRIAFRHGAPLYAEVAGSFLPKALILDEFVSKPPDSGTVSYTHLTLPTILRV